jgi:hypothetical protein
MAYKLGTTLWLDLCSEPAVLKFRDVVGLRQTLQGWVLPSNAHIPLHFPQHHHFLGTSTIFGGEIFHKFHNINHFWR